MAGLLAVVASFNFQQRCNFRFCCWYCFNSSCGVATVSSSNCQKKKAFSGRIMWLSIGKPGTTRHPLKKFFLHLRSCRRPDIELSKFYRHSLSRSRYNRPNRSLPSAWNNTFLRNRSIFSRYYARRVVPGFPVDGHILCNIEIPGSQNEVLCTVKSWNDWGSRSIWKEKNDWEDNINLIWPSITHINVGMFLLLTPSSW